MASVAPPPPPSASPSSASASAAQEKASRNKRKYRADPPAAETGPFALPYPPPDCAGYDLFPSERAAVAATAGESVNLEHLASVCDMCKTIVCGGGHGLGEQVLDCQGFDVNWSDPNEAQLEEILLKNLDSIFDNAVSAFTSLGYSEEVARAAVIRTGTLYGWRENLSSFAESALEVLKTEADSLPSEGVSVEDLRKLERAVLAGMITMVGEAQPFFSAGEAMFCLLLSDLNVARACAVDYEPAPALPANVEVLAQQVVAKQAELGSSSNVTPSSAVPDSRVTLKGKLSSVLPTSHNAAKTDVSTVLGIPNLPNGKSSVSGNMQCVVSNLKPKEHPVAFPEHSEDQPFIAAATQSLKDDKPISGKKVTLGSSKRDSAHRQKSMSFEKSFRALGSKGSLRSCKHTSSTNAVLDRKCKSFSDSTGISLKSSSKVGKVITASVTRSEVSLDLSFSAELPSSPFDSKQACNSIPAPAANTELSLSVPSTSNGSACSLNQDSAAEVPNSSSHNIFSYDNVNNDWVPQDRKDEMAMMLVRRLKDMQIQMQDWTDWAQQKVMQVARRLGKDKEELQLLRQEKEEVGRLQEERRNLEESTRKKLAEMESAISKASGQVERANAAARRLEAENAQLSLQMEAAKRQAAESAANCQELARKEENTLKRFQSWESQRAQLQEELAAEKCKLSQFQQQLGQAREQREQLQTRWRQEETLKNEAITHVSLERKEREQIETSSRSEENSLILKAENDMQRYKSDIRTLEQQISQLKVSLDSPKVAPPRWGTDRSYASRLSEAQKDNNAHVLAKIVVSQHLEFDDIQRERECVMCLSEEMSVVFLPCAHQVVCTKCNDLHEKQGMKDCPSCRTPIQRRVCARTADF